MRNLASIQTIDKIEPIENAEFIEKATIQGWNVVIKKGQFKVGDKAVYFQIDSLLPNKTQFAFLNKGDEDPEKKIRLRTVKLRGVISQGLLLPLEEFPEISSCEVDEDLSEILGIEKYEPEIPVQLAGDAERFNWPITKTDEIRIQDSPNKFISSIKGKPYYITLKLDGSSGSYILEENEFHACSRNLSLKEKQGNGFWEIAKKYGIKDKLLAYKEATGISLSTQGEVVGPGIQGNKLGLKKIDYFVFNVIETSSNKRLSFQEAISFCEQNKLNFVPILEVGDSFPYDSLEELLELAKGKYIEFFPSAKKEQYREGIVIRSQDQEISFKVINNDFLLKGGD